jgi:23S rRNA (cytidine1920-2'-O)/16S rRNA (cytidine1409-2'-O)-methyltransferase
MPKIRLDIELVNRELTDSRNRAQTLIRAGQVMINQQKAVNPSQLVTTDTVIKIIEPLKYVSRGGLKLEHALRQFDIDPQGFICLDIGASTGGFTDCLLQHGAKKIYAIDVGHGQLAEKLRHNPRVVNMEKTHFIKINQLPTFPDLITIDVSFISLTKILDHLLSILPNKKHVKIIALLKPQFETEAKYLQKGVVKNTKIHQLVNQNFQNFCRDKRIKIIDHAASPIKGPKGNIEFLYNLSI